MNVQTTLIFLPLLACGNPDAKYADAVARCELAPTCAEAIQCRKDAATAAGRDPEKVVGRCER